MVKGVEGGHFLGRVGQNLQHLQLVKLPDQTGGAGVAKGVDFSSSNLKSVP